MQTRWATAPKVAQSTGDKPSDDLQKLAPAVIPNSGGNASYISKSTHSAEYGRPRLAPVPPATKTSSASPADRLPNSLRLGDSACWAYSAMTS